MSRRESLASPPARVPAPHARARPRAREKGGAWDEEINKRALRVIVERRIASRPASFIPPVCAVCAPPASLPPPLSSPRPPFAPPPPPALFAVGTISSVPWSSRPGRCSFRASSAARRTLRSCTRSVANEIEPPRAWASSPEVSLPSTRGGRPTDLEVVVGLRVAAHGRRALTSMSHGLRSASIMTSYPYISKQCLSLMMTFATAHQELRMMAWIPAKHSSTGSRRVSSP